MSKSSGVNYIAANQRMHVSRRVEFFEVVGPLRRPRDPYRSPKEKCNRVLTSIGEWESFLAQYRQRAALRFEREGLVLDDARWQHSKPAIGVETTEARLGITLPPELRTFYQTCDGWPADGWFNPAINRLHELDWLEAVNPSLYNIVVATESETWEGRPDDVPDLIAHRFDQGTSVKRSLAITFDENDQPTLLFDVQNDWRFGSWAHWNPAMMWFDGTFSDYMVERLDRLLDD